jgi:hypothetical protein
MSTPPTTTLSGKDKEAFDSFKDEILQNVNNGDAGMQRGGEAV